MFSGVPSKHTNTELGAYTMAWQLVMAPAEKLLAGLRFRGDSPVTAELFQGQIFRYLDLSPSLRPKNCPEGDQVALSEYLRRILAPRLKGLIAEFSRIQGRYNYGAAPELCYRVVESLVAVRIALDALRCGSTDTSAVVNDISNCSTIARTGANDILAGQRRAGELNDMHRYLNRLAATGPLPLLGDVFFVRDDIVPHYLGGAIGFVSRFRALVDIAKRNLWTRTGNSILLGCREFLKKDNPLQTVQKDEARQILNDAERYVQHTIRAYFRDFTDRKAEPPELAFMGVSLNSDSFRSADRKISMVNFCGLGPVLFALKLSVYLDLPVGEQRGLQQMMGVMLRSGLPGYERKIRTRHMISHDPTSLSRLGRFRRDEMPCLLRAFAEVADEEIVNDVMPAVFKKFMGIEDTAQVAFLVAARLWGERRYSASGDACYQQGTDLVTSLINALELFQSRDERNHGAELKMMVSILAKASPQSSVLGIRDLVGTVSRQTARHIVGAFCSSDSLGSDLRWVANKLSIVRISTVAEDQIRRAGSFAEIERIASKL